uniref:Protein kinase domain-containing protein n=1 Tax=Caenorhabditis tropicalis TaxID=1561998 RepID=A0A1I7URU8_9PELO
MYRLTALFLNEKVAEPYVPINYGKVEDYRILNCLCEGAFSKTDLVRHERTKELFAVKMQHKEIVQEKQRIQNAIDELNILKRLDSPFLPTLKAAFQTNHLICLVLSGVEGRNVKELIKTNGAGFEPASVLFYMAELFFGIEYLHNHDIAHRDLTIDCLHIGRDGHIRICDFQSAKGEVKENTVCYTLCTALEYLAPETLKGRGYKRSVDWYSYGLVLVELSGVKNPYRRDTYLETIRSIGKTTIERPYFPFANDAAHLLENLLVIEGERYDSEQIFNHWYFKTVDWAAIRNQTMPPPPLRFLGQVEDKPLANGQVSEASEEDLFKDFDYDASRLPRRS